MTYPACNDRQPATPLKAIFAHLLVAGIVLGGAVSARANEACQAPCTYANGSAPSLVAAQKTSTNPADNPSYTVTVNDDVNQGNLAMVTTGGLGGFAVNPNGSLELTDYSSVDATSGNGNGIYNNGGTVTLSTHSGVDTSSGTGIYNNAGIVTLTDSNVDTSSGTGIYNNGWTVTLTDSSVDTSSGTGIYNNAGMVKLTDSEVATNSGLGINNSGTMTLTDSQVSTKTGTGIYSTGGSVTLDNSYVEVGGQATGIESHGGTVSLEGSTVSAGGMGLYGYATTSFTVTDSSVTAGTYGLYDYANPTPGGSSITPVSFTLNNSTVHAGIDALYSGGSVALHADHSQLDSQGTAIVLYGGNNIISLTNGTQVSGANGTLMELLDSNTRGAPSVNLTADGNVILNGDIDVNGRYQYGQDVANVTLQNNSALTGNINYNGGWAAIGDVSLLSGSTLTGNITHTSGSYGDVTLDGNAILNGDINYLGGTSTQASGNVQLKDSSQMNGDIGYSGGATGNVLLDNSQLTGSIKYTDAASKGNITLQNNAAMKGDINYSGGASGNVSLSQAQLTGNINYQGTQSTQTVSLDHSTLTGNVNADAHSTVNMNLADSSQFNGAVQNVNVTLDDSSVWNMTGSSSVNTLDMGGMGVNFAAPPGAYATLNTNTLSGGGSFTMHTDLAGNQGDKLVVNQASGTYQVRVIDDSKTAAPLNQQYQLINVGATPSASVNPSPSASVSASASPSASPATFKLAGGESDVGAYQYGLNQSNDGSASLYNTGRSTDTVMATRAAQQAVSGIWFNELQPLYARMGDLRMSPNSDGVWMRSYGGKERMSSNGSGVDMTGYMVEAGFDHRVRSGNGSWYLGATVGNGNVQQSFADGAGSGTATPTTVGTYATWVSDRGWYTDFILKYDSLDQRYNTVASGEGISASYHVNGVTASAETGMRFAMPNQWFVEPQMELAALYQGGMNYATTYGTPVTGSAGTAATARVSLMVGHPLAFKTASQAFELEPYANLSLIRELTASSDVTVAGTNFSDNDQGNRAQLALGMSLQPVHNWQGFMQVAYGKGQHYEQPWGFDVGVKKIW